LHVVLLEGQRKITFSLFFLFSDQIQAKVKEIEELANLSFFHVQFARSWFGLVNLLPV